MYLKGEPSADDYITLFHVKVPWLGEQEVKALCRRWMQEHHPEVDFRIYVEESNILGFFMNGTFRIEFGIDDRGKYRQLEKAVKELEDQIGDILLDLHMQTKKPT